MPFRSYAKRRAWNKRSVVQLEEGVVRKVIRVERADRVPARGGRDEERTLLGEGEDQVWQGEGEGDGEDEHFREGGLLVRDVMVNQRMVLEPRIR